MPYVDANNPKVLIDLDKCTGCLNCQLICSFTYNEIFNPALAHIKIIRTADDGKGASFTDDCLQCSICADYCVYGALSRMEGK